MPLSHQRRDVLPPETPLRAAMRAYDAEALSWQYNPRAFTPDFEAQIGAGMAEIAATLPGLRGERDIRYGPGPRQVLDVFLPHGPGLEVPGGAAVCIFIHGGYWRALDKASVAGAASAITRAGHIAVTPNYDLCPGVTVSQIVDQIGECLSWVADNIERFGGSAERIVVGGHSAGAHLAAAVAASNRPLGPRIRGLFLASGVFDIEPVRHAEVNLEIGVTTADSASASPYLAPPDPEIPLYITVGANESEAWRHQTTAFAEVCAMRGSRVTQVIVPGADHFSIALGAGGKQLAQAAVRFIEDVTA